MFRRVTAFILLTLLGLYLPATAASMCLCLGQAGLALEQVTCASGNHCCGDEVTPMGCCHDPECCFALPELPDGTEPNSLQTPNPVAAVAFIPHSNPPVAARRLVQGALWHRSNPPPPGTPTRVILGVWRL